MNANIMENKIEQKLIVDGKEVSFSNEKNLLEVIRKAGIEVPTFCYRPDLSTYGACRMCVVEIEGMGIQTSCTVKPQAGMKVQVNTEKTRKIRKMTVELLLASHNRDCTICAKSENCDLQDLAKKLGVRDVRFPSKEKHLPIDDKNPSIVRDPSKCILCGACVRACKEIQGTGCLSFVNRGSEATVMPAYGKGLDEVDCTYCGQCTAVCPTGALRIKSDIDRVWEQILDPKKKVVVQIAPAVRIAAGETFGLPYGENTLGLITAALRKIGFDSIFDTCFTADLTIMEEASEFIERFKKGENLPLFTSCCPAWVRFLEQRYPSFLKNLSTCKSPQQMFGSVAKKVLIEEFNLNKPADQQIKKEDIVIVSIMPCTAKKAECNKEEFKTDDTKDVDFVLTTQEMIRMINEAGVDFKHIEPEHLDSPFGIFSGAGVIFGSSGGVAEAALRTAYETITGRKIEKVAITEARGLHTVKELSIKIDEHEVKVAIVNTLSEASALLERIKNGEAHYHMVEVMACPGGCLGGAGQPPSYKDREIKERRMKGLYDADVHNPIHKSHDNPEIIRLYQKWLEKPNSHIAHELLHTHYKNRKRIFGEIINLSSVEKGAKVTDVQVCVGTNCYAKGSYGIIEALTKLIKENNLENNVNIRATFCMEHCSEGPSVVIDGELILKATLDKIEGVFKDKILSKYQK
ncbi:MAG TPA: NADH-dependent [FeFe] hydrogenase, group A6 [Candidatus Gastranaerophilales bacterium]|nr:NADH-dependent [FeFe] hydrogenase, group A6 [Candidatus Gastranaerophilales bacterium]